MKKFAKIVVLALAVLMVFSVASTAFAYASDGFPSNEWNQGRFGVLRNGSNRNSVFACQRMVDVTPDGVFGTNTANAVKAYQRNKGLSADGVVGTGTWTAFRNQISCREALSNQTGWSITPGGYTAFLHYSNGSWLTWTRNSALVTM